MIRTIVISPSVDKFPRLLLIVPLSTMRMSSVLLSKMWANCLQEATASGIGLEVGHRAAGRHGGGPSHDHVKHA
jgi:hypothetical protein